MLVRLRRFRDRHRGQVVRKVAHEALSRLWIHAWVRRVARPLFPARQPDQWAFMTGCYNSGTTILREILGAHPDIATLPREGVRFTDVFPDLQTGGWTRMWHRNAALADMSGHDPAAVARRAAWDWAPWWRRGARVFLEKSITHSARMPFLARAFPEASFIFVIRNGFCASEGILRRARPGPEAARALGRDTYPPAEAATQWRVANETYLRDRPGLGRVLEVRYEAFAERPGEVLRDILAFLDLPDAPLEDLGGGKVAMGARTFTIRDQNAESLARLSPAEKAEIAEVIVPLMRQLGYDVPEDGS